jgi:hypothetical protein
MLAAPLPAAVFVLLGWTVVPVAAQQGSPSCAFVDVSVLPMDGTAPLLPHRTVIVRDRRIAAVGPMAGLRLPAWTS